MINLNELTLAELKELAKENNIKNISKLKKDELIIVLKQILNIDENTKMKEEIIEPETMEIEEKEITEKHYDENGEPIVDYKLTNENDEIVEGILDILPDGYRLFKRRKLFI